MSGSPSFVDKARAPLVALNHPTNLLILAP
jgi:hypothetical protein